MSFYVYLLECSNNNTYIGATVDLNRRLRQHNSEIKGGAIATTSKVKKGEIWERIIYVKGFPSWSAALQFEWRWKQISRKISNFKNIIERRLIALKKLLSLEQSTSKAIPFSQWEKMPEILFEKPHLESLYNELSII